MLGILLVGFGYATIFQAALNYLVDTFQDVAASAVAANTLMRCVLAGAFPLVAHPCRRTQFLSFLPVCDGTIICRRTISRPPGGVHIPYLNRETSLLIFCYFAVFNNLGIHWASSLLGFIAVGLIPIPFLFYVYGKTLRQRGTWSQASL